MKDHIDGLVQDCSISIAKSVVTIDQHFSNWRL